MIHKSDHREFFSNNLFEKNTTIIDVGCGPLTAGLAYADFINRESNNQTKVTYFGVDISSQILNKAKDFASSPVFTPGSKFSFHRNWNEVSLNLENDQPILFIFSYLFANLNEEQTDDLANFTQAIIDQYQASNPIFLLFQNPDDYEKNKMFYRFKKNVSISVIGEGNDHVLYRTKNYSNSFYDPSQEFVKYVVMASPSTNNRLILHSFLNGQFPNN
ncbi:hypothetical protein I5M27_08650 [Adhaeribacter sp. BT258]|uniref:Methyltransferase domain-containing protein n=1 Tax=Adhaeribacter terrigena TaxID=2793070 RepID=A0ABS1C0X4_9BACT|nr:hypothetical protein [Adhaeribacter terrigena]MBK0403054.1 hypothetical protein [Adhaeribacter terrigena]